MSNVSAGAFQSVLELADELSWQTDLYHPPLRGGASTLGRDYERCTVKDHEICLHFIYLNHGTFNDRSHEEADHPNRPDDVQ